MSAAQGFGSDRGGNGIVAGLPSKRHHTWASSSLPGESALKCGTGSAILGLPLHSSPRIPTDDLDP